MYRKREGYIWCSWDTTFVRYHWAKRGRIKYWDMLKTIHEEKDFMEG